ncbi:MAG TPA: succinate dehydrogenase, cytochrome b556 subunit [Hyphomicrobiaceae bacterium]|nr:succinate dehydrogenase, cytochrome b556 subunit [Hyphomicrobiaceae bacterium]
MSHPHNTSYRGDRLWLAAMVHRVSGVLLAAFLPLHFLVLGLAIEGEGQLDGFLQWTKTPLVKFAETGLVLLLAIHLLGGIRVLVIENMPWREGQKRMATLAAAAAVCIAGVFLVALL